MQNAVVCDDVVSTFDGPSGTVLFMPHLDADTHTFAVSLFPFRSSSHPCYCICTIVGQCVFEWVVDERRVRLNHFRFDDAQRPLH